MTLPRNKEKLRLGLLVTLLPFLLFLTNLDGTWILDDHYQVEQNPYVQSIEHLPRLWTTRVWASTSLETRGSDIYRPMFMSSFLVDAYLFNLSPWGSHLLNNLLHAINALLIFLLVSRFTPGRRAAWAALIFGLHPMVVESVTWISGRMDLLVTLFALINLLALTHLFDPKAPTRPKWLALFLISIPLGIFSKEVFVAIPFLAMAGFVLASPQPKVLIKKTLWISASALGLTLLCLLWRKQIVSRDILQLLAWENLRNASALVARFLTLFFNPSDSDFFFRFPARAFMASRDLAPFALVLTGLGAAIRRFRKSPLGWSGLALICGALIPLSLIVDLLQLLSERYFYLPFAGFSILVVVLVQPVWDYFEREKQTRALHAVKILALVWLVLMSLLTVARNREWHDEVRLYAASITRDASSHLPHFYLAWTYAREGEPELEIQSYQEVLIREPKHLPSLNNLAVRLIERGHFRTATALLKRAHQEKPGRAKTLYNWGYLMEKQDKYGAASSWYAKAIQMDPGYELAKASLFRVRQLIQASSTPPSK